MYVISSPVQLPILCQSRQRFHVEVVAPADAFVNALGRAGVVGALFAVGAVAHKADALRAFLDGVVRGHAAQHLGGQLRVLGSFVGAAVLGGLQQAAGHDGRGGGVAWLLGAAGEGHIPVRDQVLGQALQIVGQHAAEGVQILGASGVAVADGRAVDAPRLTAGPAGVILIALTGRAAHRAAGHGVHEEGVVGRAVRADGVGQTGRDMLVRQIGVVGVAGGLAGPVEQRHVQQAVDDVAVVVGSAERAPRLKELALLLKAGAELVGSQDSGLSPLLTASQLVGGDTGRAVQEAHVVVVDLDLVLNAVEEAVHEGQRGIFERLVAGALIAQPDLTGPEAAGPLVVLALGIDVMDAGMVLAVVGIQRQIPADERDSGIQRLLSLGFGQDFV